MEGEPIQASAPARAVFLSYASQDAEAAQRICEALRSAGIEVWFDQSELRGGDAWDRQIRRQIHDCTLFIPVISAHSDARREGYFRREWKLAVDRTADMAEDVAFLLPVVIDTTPDATARAPHITHAIIVAAGTSCTAFSVWSDSGSSTSYPCDLVVEARGVGDSRRRSLRGASVFCC